MHILNAEVYHTPLDVLSHVKTGVLQGDGDNTLYMYSNRVVFYCKQTHCKELSSRQ